MKREAILGKNIDAIPFYSCDDDPDEGTPWSEAAGTGCQITGRLMGIALDGFRDKTYSVGVAIVSDEKSVQKGLLISFEDVSVLEDKKRELRAMVTSLNESSDKIREQNRKLEQLATTDPLTNCLNRRAFFELFEKQWEIARRDQQPLSALMVDIDHFKSINDNHGHSKGDEVLHEVAAVLLRHSNDAISVCRYGGEEFAVLLRGMSIEEAAQHGEVLRSSIEALELGEVSVTASLGTSSTSQRPGDPQELLDQADKCLYVAKRSGRNQVVRWDQVPDDIEIDESKISRTKPTDAADSGTTIPFQAVSALFSALSYRDSTTATHCRRVADLSARVGQQLLSLKDCYTLEIAALLHDIGKIGVPDSILLKPEALSSEEWEVMAKYERVGIEIIRSSFGSEELAVIVQDHRLTYSDMLQSPYHLEHKGTALSSRILAVADAYDSMTSTRSYREGMSHENAILELRRCAGTQFDPQVVEHFADCIESETPSDLDWETQLSRELAVDIGMQTERLATALDTQNIAEIRSLAERLATSASRNGADEIATLAHSLANSAIEDVEDEALLSLLGSATQLLEACRATQRKLLEVSD